MRPIHAAIFLLLACCALPLRAEEAVHVEKTPPAIERKRFDPRHPPADMPPLAPGEAALTNAAFGVNSDFRAEVLSEQQVAGRCKARLKITGITISTMLTITIWLPTDSPASIKTHEEAHRKLSELCYDQAEQIATNLARKFIGQAFTGEGATPEAARKAAIEKGIIALNAAYLQTIQAPAARINDIFDQITDHGRNKIPVDQAMQQAVEQYRNQRQKREGKS